MTIEVNLAGVQPTDEVQVDTAPTPVEAKVKQSRIMLDPNDALASFQVIVKRTDAEYQKKLSGLLTNWLEVLNG